MNKINLLIINVLIFQLVLLLIFFNDTKSISTPIAEDTPPIQHVRPEPKIEEPIQNNITNPKPDYMTYDQTVSQLKKWNGEAPELTEVGVYGQSSKKKDLYYIRIKNKRNGDKPKVLITACLHGNEPLSSSTTMWYIGSLLDGYGKDEKITFLLDNRDIYFVPVVSPDSYPNSRWVDGVDPNRNFPGPHKPNHRSIPPVKAIQDLFLDIKPKAMISGHTWGRVYLTPYGDRMDNCPDHDEYQRVIGEMSKLSGYRNIRASDLYMSNGRLNNPPIRLFGRRFGGYTVSSPIYGTEVDWYYRGGAFSIVMEFGTHQRIPSRRDTEDEFNRTFKAVQHFIEEGPLVELK